jgi:transcriptional regulator with XRE-family HTH domain
MIGSRALGVCIRKHRAHRPVQVLADALGKSTRWLAYIESGHTAPSWIDLLEIARILGPVDGASFLKESALLLFEEADMARIKADVMAAVQRREFLAVLGVGALVDMERLDRVLEGLGVDAATVNGLAELNRLYAEQSRRAEPGLIISGLQGHLRSQLEIAASAPEAMSVKIKALAAEAALLAGMLAFRVDHPTEALHYWMLANGLAEDSHHRVAQAYVLAARGSVALSPSNFGGLGGNAKEARRLLDQALAVLGVKASGVAPATVYAWRSVQQALLGDAKKAEEDLASADWALNNASTDTTNDLCGLAAKSRGELDAERAVCALWLGQHNRVVEILESGEVADQRPSPGWRAARMADLAAAHAARGDQDHAASVLLDATNIAIGAKDPWRIRRIRGIRRRWLSDKLAGDVVQELDQKLAGLRPAAA